MLSPFSSENHSKFVAARPQAMGQTETSKTKKGTGNGEQGRSTTQGDHGMKAVNLYAVDHPRSLFPVPFSRRSFAIRRK
jgi:hypothetical protein